MFSELSVPRAPKWPFLLGDALLLGCAYFIYRQARLPFGPWELGAVVACVAGGAWFAARPFVLDYQAAIKLAETQRLTETVAQIQRLDTLAAQISNATSQWQNVQEVSSRTAKTAHEIGQQIAMEAQGFMEFLKKANDGERGTLKLEIEKLRRAEGDWIQVLMRVLDHILALHGAAARSGKPSLAQQLTQFRDACLEVTRRIGLLPFGAPPGHAFDVKLHQRFSGDEKVAEGARVGETLAPGYTFQGQPVRRALVLLEGDEPPQPAAESAPAAKVEEKPAAPPVVEPALQSDELF